MNDADHDAVEDAFPAPLASLVAAERHRQGPARHAAPETLTAYHAGALDDDAAEALRDHLAVCPHCARLLLDLAAFVDTPLAGAGDGAGPDQEGTPTDDDWEALRRRLPPPPPTAAAYRPAAGRDLLLAAAALLAAILFTGGWFLGARSRGPATVRHAVVQLAAADLVRSGGGGGGALPPTPLSADSGFTLVLHLTRPQPDLHARAEIRDGGTPAAAGDWRPLDLQVVMPGPRIAVLDLAPHQLAPGPHDLRLVDPASPAADPLGVYSIAVVSP